MIRKEYVLLYPLSYPAGAGVGFEPTTCRLTIRSNSSLRHLLKYMQGNNLERHLYICFTIKLCAAFAAEPGSNQYLMFNRSKPYLRHLQYDNSGNERKVFFFFWLEVSLCYDTLKFLKNERAITRSAINLRTGFEPASWNPWGLPFNCQGRSNAGPRHLSII